MSTPEAPPPGGRRRLWLLTIGGIVLLALGVWLVSSRLTRLLTTAETPEASAQTPPPGTVRRIQATLFYVTNDGTELTPVSREVVYAPSPTEQIRAIVEAQVAAPPDGRISAIPNHTTVRSVFLTSRGEAFVDLGGAIRSGHTGGTLDEALCVYAIVNAVIVNLPDVSAVQILIDGRQVDTLAGHLDLRYPLGKGLEWVRKGT
jgi:spore germination protein GerM